MDGEKSVADIGTTRQSLPIMLLRAREAVMAHFRPLLREHDVTEQQWRVLRVLDEFDETDVTTISQQAAILAPSLTRILKSLKERGLVTIRRDQDDARRSLASLTDEGNALIAKAKVDSAQIYAGISQQIGEDRIATLIDDLDTLIRVLGERSDPR